MVRIIEKLREAEGGVAPGVVATKFFACVACGKAYWNGSHWRRIEAVRAEMERMVDALSDG